MLPYPEALIEAAIARLDAIDGNRDFENGHDAEADDCEASAEQAPVIDYECSPARFRAVAS